jgi:hypothetical protein
VTATSPASSRRRAVRPLRPKSTSPDRQVDLAALILSRVETSRSRLAEPHTGLPVDPVGDAFDLRHVRHLFVLICIQARREAPPSESGSSVPGNVSLGLNSAMALARIRRPSSHSSSVSVSGGAIRRTFPTGRRRRRPSRRHASSAAEAAAASGVACAGPAELDSDHQSFAADLGDAPGNSRLPRAAGEQSGAPAAFACKSCSRT